MRTAGLTPGIAGAVAGGGFVGTLLRYSLAGIAPDDLGFPWTTLAINVVGCLVLGLLTAVWLAGGPGSRSAALRAAVGPGLLGSFTTFSAVAVHLAAGARYGVPPSPGQAAAYLAASLVLGLAAAGGGLWLGGVLARRRGNG